jgi:hypothetical protein
LENDHKHFPLDSEPPLKQLELFEAG